MNRKSENSKVRKPSHPCLKPAYAAVLLAFSVQTAQANPTGGSVVSGSASFATSGNSLTVTNTPGTIINWKGFSIGSSEITSFVQQSASSTVLNRVTGNNPSNILGTLQSNGRVFLINPHGIVFGAGSVVDVAGMVASTLNLSDADFKNNKYHFTKVPGAADISNDGNITAHGDGQQGGQIVLIAHNVKNSGVITAPNGEILLVAGAIVDLVNTNDLALRVSITAPAGNVTNVGQLVASAGSLGLFGTVVGNSGLVSADSATMEGGKIVFKASKRVDAGGTISAQGSGGGTIDLLANKKSGTVNVTGTLDASAPVSGNGGFIDTSAAHVKVSDSAHITTAAANGKSGTWLIDPLDFAIGSNAGNDITGTALSTMLVSNNVVISTVAGTNSATNLYATKTGNGDIFVNDAVAWNANTLTLNATRNIYINAYLNANLVGAGPSTAGLVLQYGQGAAASGNKANYVIAPGMKIDLSSTGSFSTKLGSNGNVINYTIITDVGTQGSISTADLQGMNGNLAGNYVLGADIDASATGSWNAGAGFVQIGGNTNPAFTGQFDGLGHTVRNLYIYRPSENYVGLFGYTSGGNISNVTLANVNVTGNYYVGGLVGYNYDTISNSSVSSGSVTGNYYVGGLAGLNYGAIYNSSAGSWVRGNGYEVGGLVGGNGGTIDNSSATYNVTGTTSVGGLAGSNSGTISNSYVSSGYVWGSSHVGGLVGGNSGQVINSHYNINGVAIQDSTYVTLGGLYNDHPSNGDAGQYDDWLNHGLKLDIANYTVANGGSYGTSGSNNYTISDVQGMKDLLGFSDNKAYTFTLINNIGLVNNQDLHIPYLAAHFNGANFTISDLNIDQVSSFSGGAGNDNLGLFGNIASTGTVSNVILKNASVTGNSNIGALAGWNQGSISNSYINNKSDYAGNVSGTSNIGGMVGRNDGTVSNSFIDNSNSLGGGYVSGTSSNVGGLVGYNYAGTISGSHVDNSNAYGGSVSGTNNVGGLVGENYAIRSIIGNTITSSGGIISSSYVTNALVNGGYRVGGLVGFSSLGSISKSYVYGGNVTGSIVGNFTGDQIGGLVGYNDTNIDSSYAYGGLQVKGANYVGGLVGYNDGAEGGGNISNSHFSDGTVTGTSYVGGLGGYMSYVSNTRGVSGGVVSNSYVTNGVVSGSNTIGGLAGYSATKISGSYVSGGTVTAAGNNAGGLVGYNTGMISSSYASGGIVNGNGSGSSDIGGLVGYNLGTVDKSYVKDESVTGVSDVGGLAGLNQGGDGGAGFAGTSLSPGAPGAAGTTSTISNSYVSGGTVSGGTNVGGVVGMNRIGNAGAAGTGAFGGPGGAGGAAIISNSYISSGAVTATGNNAGGVAGYNTGTISSSYASGGSVKGNNNIGGLVGYNIGTVDKNSYVKAGNVTGAQNVGGLVGYNASSSTSGPTVSGTISNSYVSSGTIVNGTTNVGGLAGYNAGSGSTTGNIFGATITSSYVSSGVIVNGGTNVGGLAGYNAGAITSSYASGGSVTGNLYVGGLAGYSSGLIDASYTKGGSMSGNASVGGLVGQNTGNISASYDSGSAVNASSNNSDVGGLVGNNTGTINSSYADGSIVFSNAGDGIANAGGLAGNNSGTISNSYTSNATVSGNSSLAYNFGGLVGYNSGGIDTSFASNGKVSGPSSVGGLVGYNVGTISNTYASGGTLSGSYDIGGLVGYNVGSISTSYASETITAGGSSVGGLVGYNSGGSASNNFWNTTVTAGVSFGVGTDSANAYGSSNIGATGMNDAAMKSEANFTTATVANGNVNPGWDFTSGTVWHITEGVSMPLLPFSPPAVAVLNVDEIVDISNQRAKRSLDDALTEDFSSGEGGNSLPMCN